jgi:hypothetical protein
MGDVALAQTLGVVTSQDMNDLSSDGNARVLGHRGSGKVDDDGQTLDAFGHKCDSNLEMESNVADLGCGGGGVFETGLHVEQWVTLSVEATYIQLAGGQL